MSNSNVQVSKKSRSKKAAPEVVAATLASTKVVKAPKREAAGINHAELTEKARGRKANPESGQQKAFAFYAANPTMARKDFISHCIANLGLSKAASSTYYVNARKHVNK